MTVTTPADELLTAVERPTGTDAAHAARVDLAALVRACVLHDFHEGIDTRRSQNASKFHSGRYAEYPAYGARFLSPAECAPVADVVAAGARVVLLRNHGVLVVGETVARAWWDLYFFERACMVQVLAGASGQRPAPMPDEAAHRAAEQFEEERDDAPLTWAAVRRRIDRELPGYDR